MRSCLAHPTHSKQGQLDTELAILLVILLVRCLSFVLLFSLRFSLSFGLRFSLCVVRRCVFYSGCVAFSIFALSVRCRM